MTTIVQLSDEVIQRLRALRLWHWKQALLCRNSARMYSEMTSEGWGDPGANADRSSIMDKRAGFHLTQVQTLNEFFVIGDTAEGDAANENNANKNNVETAP